MHAFTIKDLENLSGIKAHTIRIWEQRYSFLNPSRTDTNIRYYSNEELKTVLNIALLNKYGYKISHIDRMSDTEIKDKILSLSQIEAQQERIINEMIHCMVDMNMESFEKLLNENVSLRGIEKTITQFIFPFLERIGILWMTNHINPAQEHLVTNIIRQKLIVGIDGTHTLLSSKSLILLFLPEGEHHELGLLFVYYLLKRRGVKVIYLGSNVPVKDMEYVAKLKQPDAIFTHLTSVANHFNFEKFLNNMQARLPEMPLVVSGQITQSYKKKAPQNTHLKKTLSEVMDYIGLID
jgi:DNA-binding transcriptional MerR regulator/methylmalonyl-CoA mutase cobalamin-binding subunit